MGRACGLTGDGRRRRLHLTLPPPDTPLKTLRRSLAEYTHLPPDGFKLIHSGAVMRDDNAPSECRLVGSMFWWAATSASTTLSNAFLVTVSAYGIRDKSTIALLPSGPPPGPNNTSTSKPLPATPKPKPAAPTEQSTIAAIHSELGNVRSTLLPCVDVFLHSLPAQHPPSEPAPPRPVHYAPAPTPAQEHTRLAELLLQSLLRLDAINSEGGWEDARRERKGAVKEVQGLLDRLDGGWRGRDGA
ncbi:hypothetical protein PLICRDRAFT_37606 [Plicaturopsis crispa FD-325 SS-3]|nr:hypothetical protein PLICRDRAFT_37606 [Plicaturopsis crispa FD-325 SS-3]